jgi:nucleotide-binding universal stress UspA family protein
MSADGYHRIVVPTDFSSCAEEAWTTAQRLARAFGSELILVHVMVEPTFYSGAPFARGIGQEVYTAARRWAERELEAWVAKAKASGLQARVQLRVGVAHDEIVAAATDERADLVVIGTHGRGGLNRALLGSVADRVIRLAPCPVLSVREPT